MCLNAYGPYPWAKAQPQSIIMLFAELHGLRPKLGLQRERIPRTISQRIPKTGIERAYLPGSSVPRLMISI